MQPQSHFLPLPAELRNIIYTYLLIPPPIRRLKCEDVLASTCRPQETSIRAIGEAYRGDHIHTAILRVNKLCYREAAAILYGNAQIEMRQNPRTPVIPKVTLLQVCRLHLTLDSTDNIALRTSYATFMVQTALPSVRVVSLLIKIDFTNGDSITPEDFRLLLDLDTDRISFVVDLRVTRAWECDGFWAEAISTKKGHEEAALAAENEPFRMRAVLVGCLEQWASEEGKRFRVLEG